MNIGQIIDIVIIIVFLFGIVRGWFVGLAVKVGHLLALIAACLAGYFAGTMFQHVLGEKWILPMIENKTGGVIHYISLLEKSAEAAADQAAYYLIFFVVFLVALLIFNHLVHILKIVDRIPVVGTLNKFGGALIGFVTQFIIVYIVCSVISIFVPQSSLDHIGLTKDILRETVVIQFFLR